jgi:hypothetical protein
MKTMLMRCATGVALALTGFVHAAGAQGSSVPDPTAVPQLKAEFDRASKQNVPVALLIAKARHGMMLDVPVGKIRDAVRAQAERYVTAREVLSPLQSETELAAGADALQQDIPKSVLRNLRTSHPSRSLTMSIGVLQELVARGVPVKQAVATVDRMLHNKESDVRIASLSTDIQGLLATGLAPSAAFDALSRGVLSLPQSAASGSALTPQRR